MSEQKILAVYDIVHNTGAVIAYAGEEITHEAILAAHSQIEDDVDPEKIIRQYLARGVAREGLAVSRTMKSSLQALATDPATLKAELEKLGFKLVESGEAVETFSGSVTTPDDAEDPEEEDGEDDENDLDIPDDLSPEDIVDASTGQLMVPQQAKAPKRKRSNSGERPESRAISMEETEL